MTNQNTNMKSDNAFNENYNIIYSDHLFIETTN